MREIQNLTLQLSRRGDEIANRFLAAGTAFRSWLLKDMADTDGVFGVRVTAVPVGAPLYVARVFANRGILTGIKVFKAMLGKASVQIHPLIQNIVSERPLIRGSRRERTNLIRSGYYDVYCNGVIDLSAKMHWKAISENRLYLGWICNQIANAMVAAETFARVAGNGDAEYGVEIELRSHGPGGDIRSIPILGFVDEHDPIGIINSAVVLPQVGFGDKEAALDIIFQDVVDACGCRYPLGRLVIENWQGTDR